MNPQRRHGGGAIDALLRRFEQIIVVALVAMMMAVVALSTIELGWILLRDIYSHPVLFLEVEELLEIFGFFLLILIGVELLGTIKSYLQTSVVHVEVVLDVAIIALARKVIALDLQKYSGLSLLSLAALIAALAAAAHLQRSARGRRGGGASPET